MSSNYPTSRAARDAWILERRGAKQMLDPWRPAAFLVEDESGAATATIFLTNRECPFRCLMCDLWQHTLDVRVPVGAITAQLEFALAQLPRPADGFQQIKLYNAGSFFDPQAIPPEEDAAIAALVAKVPRVIVECHPAFLRGTHGARAVRFQSLLRGQLEIAIGLETVHPVTLAQLNKRMTVADFRQAAAFLHQHAIALRTFILLRPPFLREAEGVTWACRSLDVARECGAAVAAVIPTRAGNGALEALGADYQPPTLRSLETVLEYGLALSHLRVFADLWDIQKFFTCACSAQRAARLAQMNQTQRIVAPVVCAACS